MILLRLKNLASADTKTSRVQKGRSKSCVRARSVFAPSFNSPLTCTGRPTRSIALPARNLLKGWLTRRLRALNSARPAGKCLTSNLTRRHGASTARRSMPTCPFGEFQLARPTPDGGKRHVSVAGLPVFDKSGRFIGYRGVGRHITERKKVEENIRTERSLSRRSTAVEATQARSAFNATTAVYWSDESYRIWGFDPLQGLPDPGSCIAPDPSR